MMKPLTIELSRKERLFLVKQFLIPKKLYPKDAVDYARKGKAVEDGLDRP